MDNKAEPPKDAHTRPSYPLEPASQEEEGACRICGSGESPELLITPCNCSGSLRKVHTTCLQQWILHRPDPEQYAGTSYRPSGISGGDHRMSCEICHADYRIQVDYVFGFSWQKCCSFTSLGHAFEICSILILIIMIVILYPLLNQSSKPTEPVFGSNKVDMVIIPCLLGVLGLLCVFALRKVYSRWKRANSEIAILPDGGVAVLPSNATAIPLDPIRHRYNAQLHPEEDEQLIPAQDIP